MCILCALTGQDSAAVHLSATPQFLAAAVGDPQYAAGPAGGTGVPGNAVQALLAITVQDTARWNVPAAIGTPVATPGGMGTAVSLTYGFLANQAPQPADLANFQALNAGQQAGMRAALAAWADVARISFTETAGLTADLRIGRSDQTSAGFAYFPGFAVTTRNGIITAATANPIAGDIYLSNTVADSIPPGSNGYQLALHESGHALGLKHSFEAPVALPADTESRRYTVMSYTNASNSGTVMPSTPMLYDIAAMQALYGANTATRTGNDNYSWGVSEKFLATIWDCGGIDSIDASNQVLRCVISLVDGTFSSIGLRQSEAELRMDIPAFATQVPTPSYNGQDNLAIAYGVMIENAYGGAGDDTITGNPLDNILNGGAGADSLIGGGGFDLASYLSATTGVTARLDFPALNNGDAAGDTYTGISGLSGSGFADFLVGDGNANSLYGGGGGDYLAGVGGNDMLSGDAGNDILDGGAGTDTLDGGFGDDTLDGGAGADSQIGGGGFDLASYFSATTGVTARLDIPAMNTGDAAGDTYTGIGGLSGSGFADVLVGDQNANSLYGGGGNDYLAGLGGNDLLSGDASNDTLDGGTGNDTLDGGIGNDTLDGGAGADGLFGGGGFDLASYFSATTGVTARLDIAAVNNGDAAGDTYTGIGGLYGSGFADVLVGDQNANSLYGVGGNDYLAGLGSNDMLAGDAGNDTLDGGAGNDTLDGGIGSDILDGGAGADGLIGGGGFDLASYFSAAVGVSARLDLSWLNTGDAAGDTYIGIAGLSGSGFADVLVGDENPNSLYGSGDNDYLAGQGGQDMLYGDAGDDTLEGGGRSDTLDGGLGNDMLDGGVGADFLFGGGGVDLASYFSAPAGVTARLDLFWLNTGDAEGDFYTGIAGLTGSRFGDVLVGDGSANIIYGGGGSDALTGGAGIDYFGYNIAGFGTDTVTDFATTAAAGANHDFLDFRGILNIGSTAINQVGADTYVVTNQGTVILQNITASTLVAADFLF
jgi:serralysin